MSPIGISATEARSASARELFSVAAPQSRSLEPCCDSDHALSCVDVEVDPQVLLSEDDISINGTFLLFSNTVPPHARVYKTEAGDEAVISYNPRTGSITGTLHTRGGRAFALERCGASYIWEEFDVPNFPEDNTEEAVEDEDDDDDDMPVIATNSTMRQEQKSYSVMFYYTPEFAAATPNIEDFIDQVIAETNQGYANSKIDITVTKFCAELASISEATTKEANMLTAFREMKGKGAAGRAALRNTADAAHLLVLRNSLYCGVAYCCNSWRDGWTMGVTVKSCALGHYTFGHELGHNFGGHHDPKTDTNSMFSYGHGHLIAQGSSTNTRGFHTILAYGRAGHRVAVNYYSNPSVVYPGTGTPTGVAGTEDNARVIRETFSTFAALGDESGSCSSSGGAGTGAADSGEVTSPGYPDNYANNMDTSTPIQVQYSAVQYSTPK